MSSIPTSWIGTGRLLGMAFLLWYDVDDFDAALDILHA